MEKTCAGLAGDIFPGIGEGEPRSSLHALGQAVGTHQRVKDGEHVTAVVHHAGENIAQLRVTFRFAVPFEKNGSRNFDVPAQLVRGMPAQKEAIEKCCLALREVEILHDFDGNELWHRSHGEKAVYPKASRRQVELPFMCRVPDNSPCSTGQMGDISWTLHATLGLPRDSNRRKMLVGMARLHNSVKGSLAGRTVGRFLRFGVLRGLRSVEIDPEDFRKHLARKHGLWVPDFARMRDVPIERLDAIAATLIRDAERLALAEGAGFGLGGMVTFLPDAGFLTAITLRLIQRLSLLYGFETHGRDQRMEMWKAAATAAGIDYGKDLAEKQVFEKLAPRIAERFAAKMGAEAAEKWVGRLIPLASSAIGGALNFSFVRSWGRRVQRHLRAKHLEAKLACPHQPRTYTPAEATLV